MTCTRIFKKWVSLTVMRWLINLESKCILICSFIWLVVLTILKHTSQWDGLYPIYEMDNKIHVPRIPNHQPAIILFCRGQKKQWQSCCLVPGLLSGNPQPVPQFSLRPHGQRLGRDRAITLLGCSLSASDSINGELPEPGT